MSELLTLRISDDEESVQLAVEGKLVTVGILEAETLFMEEGLARWIPSMLEVGRGKRTLEKPEITGTPTETYVEASDKFGPDAQGEFDDYDDEEDDTSGP